MCTTPNRDTGFRHGANEFPLANASWSMRQYGRRLLRQVCMDWDKHAIVSAIIEYRRNVEEQHKTNASIALVRYPKTSKNG